MRNQPCLQTLHTGITASRPALGKEDLQSNGLPPRWDVGEHKVCGQELDNSDKDVAQEKVYSAHGSGLFLDLGVSSCCWIFSCGSLLLNTFYGALQKDELYHSSTPKK